jgi:hypothetical protein
MNSSDRAAPRPTPPGISEEILEQMITMMAVARRYRWLPLSEDEARRHLDVMATLFAEGPAQFEWEPVSCRFYATLSRSRSLRSELLDLIEMEQAPMTSREYDALVRSTERLMAAGIPAWVPPRARPTPRLLGFPEMIATRLRRVLTEARHQIAGAGEAARLTGAQVSVLLAAGQIDSLSLAPGGSATRGQDQTMARDQSLGRVGDASSAGATPTRRIEGDYLDETERFEARIIALQGADKRWSVTVRGFEPGDEPRRSLDGVLIVSAQLGDRPLTGAVERYDPSIWTMAERLTTADLGQLLLSLDHGATVDDGDPAYRR